jgi:hypothetical protein
VVIIHYFINEVCVGDLSQDPAVAWLERRGRGHISNFLSEKK